MQDTIPISLDDRSFSFWEWLGFLFIFTFITVHFAFMFRGIIFGAIWGQILSGDYTGSELFWAIVWTSIAVPTLLLFYGPFCYGIFAEPEFSRTAVLLDIREHRLILKTRHITGRTGERTFALADIRDVKVEWIKAEDGPDVPKTRILTKREPVTVTVTNPSDANALAFAERFKAHLAAIGWKDDQA